MEYAIFKIKHQLVDLVAQAVGQEVDKSKLEITIPPEADMGDFAVPCFYLAKLLRRSPNQIANDLQSKIHLGGAVKSVQNVGPYLNFSLDPAVFGKKVLAEIARGKSVYGQLKLSKEKLMIEYSQPNTHKEFHIGHLRNAVLGSALVNLHKFVGYSVLSANYIGDVGAHVAKCLWALERFHKKEKTPADKGKYLGKIYAEAVKKIEANPDFKQQADEVLQKLENGDPKAFGLASPVAMPKARGASKKWLALWQKTRKWSLDGFNAIYKMLGIKFDYFFYESEVEKPGKKIVAELQKKGVAEKSEGALIINLEKYNLKSFLLLKSDGASLYSTKDLALAELKFKKHKIDKSIVLTDSRQSFYFQQLFKTLEVIGFKKSMVHLPYEFVTLKEGAMASREGNVVLFNDFYRQVADRAQNETKKRHQDWPEKRIAAAAEKIALSAIKFNMLKVNRGSVIVFDIDEALDFEGFTGPYIQYTLSRIASVLKKAKIGPTGEINADKLKTEVEKELILKLAEFPEAVAAAVRDYEPSEIAKYLFDLSRLFAAFYQKAPILSAEPATRKARLALIVGIRQVLVNGLGLLGIEAMTEM